MKKLLLALGITAALLTIGGGPAKVFGAAAIVQGEASPGVYENITSTSQQLNVNVAASVAPTTSVVMTITTPTVTSTTATILAANTNRKSLIIQNNDAAGIIYINFSGGATTAHLRLNPGQSLYLVGILPTSAVRAIGSIASNTSIVLMEGV